MLASNPIRRLTGWINHQLVYQKLDNPLGYLLLGFIAILLAYLIASLDFKFAVFVPVIIIVIPVLGACMYDLPFGLKIVLVTAFLIGIASKYANLPFGISLDGLLLLLFFGMLISLTKNRDSGFAKSPVSVFILIWVFYNIIEVLNPWAGSRLAWLFTVRSMAGLILLYFIACYAFKNIRTIYSTLKFIILLAFLSALYGLKQEFFGFSAAELTWLYADQERLQLIMQWSRLRIFSLFSDPTNFGILMSYMATFCIILATGPFKLWKRITLVIAALSMIMAMAFAGSRTPFVLLPFGFGIFTLMTLKKEVILTMGFLLMLGTVFVLKSTNSAVIYRIQSAFDMRKSDDTMNVRLSNQRKIQPYIHAHPFGGGLGSTGIWGKRFTPDAYLSSFAHDSGFVRIAVELGWIGFIIYLLFLFTVIKTSIFYYLRVRNRKVKVIYLGLTVVFFQLTLANYPQEAIVILPTSIIFYIFLAIMVKLKEFDDPELDYDVVKNQKTIR